MPVIGLDHILIAIPEGCEATARWFYGGLLGLAEIPKPPNLAVRGGVWFRCGPVQVHLGVEADFCPALKAHPGFLVVNLADMVRTCEAAGFPTKADEPLEGVVRVHLADPFGNRIELLERTIADGDR
jgi:catechol 2,3-dioxygenase-like lactoylglutathione lyase family enzyme